MFPDAPNETLTKSGRVRKPSTIALEAAQSHNSSDEESLTPPPKKPAAVSPLYTKNLGPVPDEESAGVSCTLCYCQMHLMQFAPVRCGKDIAE